MPCVASFSKSLYHPLPLRKTRSIYGVHAYRYPWRWPMHAAGRPQRVQRLGCVNLQPKDGYDRIQGLGSGSSGSLHQTASNPATNSRDQSDPRTDGTDVFSRYSERVNPTFGDRTPLLQYRSRVFPNDHHIIFVLNAQPRAHNTTMKNDHTHKTLGWTP